MTLHRPEKTISRILRFLVGAGVTAFLGLTAVALHDVATQPTPFVEITYGAG